MAAELICIEAELDVIEMIEMIRKRLVCVSYTKIGMNQDINVNRPWETHHPISCAIVIIFNYIILSAGKL